MGRKAIPAGAQQQMDVEPWMGCSEGTRQHCSWVCCELWAQDGQSGEMAPIMEGCSSQAQPALGVWLHGAGLKLQAAQSGCSTRLPCDTMSPQLGLPTQQHSPTRLCRQPLEPQPALETDRQTDRQTAAGYPGFVSRLLSGGSSSSADMGSPHTNPSLVQPGGQQEGLRLCRERAA